MATTIKDLLTQAAVIRDAAAEGENTAMRVGSMLIDLVQRIVDTLSADALSALGLRITASTETVTVTYKTVDAGGSAKDVSVTLPAATTTTAGMMSSASLAAINKATQDILSIVNRIDASDGSIKAASDAAKAVSDALAAHETADAAEHKAIRKSLSDAREADKQEQHDTLACSGIVAFDGFVGDVSDNTHGDTAAPIVRDPKGKVQQGAATVHFSTADGAFLIKQDGTYYPTWTDDYLWEDRNRVPWADKSYYNVNDGKLYKIGSDGQLHEIALTKLRDDTGILPCRVRTSAPLAQPATGYPTAHNYTIWWSQTAKAFFAALGYDEAAQDDAIEGCEYYPLSVCDEYTDYCTLSGSGGTQTAVPRADRIFRSGNDLWQYDKASGRMIKLGDVTGKDLAIRTLECGDATLQGDVEVTGCLEVENSLTVNDGDIACPTGEIQGYGVRGNLAKFGEAEEVKIDIDGNISTTGDVTAENITANGNITASTATLSDTTLSGDTTFDGGSVSVDSGSLSVASGVGFYADNINDVRIDGRIDFVFHGIRQSLPTDYTAVAQSVSPSTRVDGSTYDIIYIRDKKHFVAVDDTAKTYAERFYDEEEYNVITNNKPTTARTDRTWRCAGKLYAWDAEFALKDPNNLLSAYVGDLTCLNDSAKEAFIKSWNEAFYKNGRKFGEYNRETGYFEGNGLTDITYEQAKIIMKFVGICQNPSSIWRKIDGGYSHGGLGNFRFDYYGKGQDSRGPRTFPPIVNGASGGVYNSNHLLQGDICLQAASFAGSGGLTGNEYVFDSCRNLRYVLNMELNDTQGKKTGMFAGCVALETVELKYLTQGTVSFEQSPKLTLDSIKYMLNNRRKDGDMLSNEKYKFTIKLHADVFAKLTDDIIALATEMNATLVSA